MAVSAPLWVGVFLGIARGLARGGSGSRIQPGWVGVVGDEKDGAGQASG